MGKQISGGTWHANAMKAGRIIGDETVNDTFDKITINASNCTIATVYRRADATLIKSAPDLLAACEAALAAVVELDNADDPLSAMQQPSPLREMLERAIAAAKGE